MSFACHSYVILTSLACARILSVCTRMSPVGHSYVLVCNGMSLEYTHMSFVCRWYVLVCHPYDPYVTPMYSYVPRMSFVCHPCVTRMYSYVTRISLVCTRISLVCHWPVVLP